MENRTKSYFIKGAVAAFAAFGASAFAAPAGTILNEHFTAASAQTFTVIGASDQPITGLTDWSYRALSGESADGAILDQSGNKRVARVDPAGTASTNVDVNSITAFRANVPGITMAVGQSVVIQCRYNITTMAANFNSNTNARISFTDQAPFGVNENGYTIEGLNGPLNAGNFNDMDFLVWTAASATETAFEAPSGNANSVGIRAAGQEYVIRVTFTKTNATTTTITWQWLDVPALFANGSSPLVAAIADGVVLDTVSIVFGGNYVGWVDDVVIAEGSVTSVPDWKNFIGFLTQPQIKPELAQYAPTQAPWTSPMRVFRTVFK